MAADADNRGCLAWALGGAADKESELHVVTAARRRRLLSPVALSVSLAALALGAPAAQAGPLVASVTSCADQPLSQPFLPWLDPSLYTLVPDGTFENKAAGWSLTGDAAPVRGSEPYAATGDLGLRSLALPAASSATSPVFCAGIGHPTLRFFARRTGGSLLGLLRVDVLFEDATGAVQTLTLGRLADDGDWSPSPTYAVGASLLALLPDDRTPLEFRFTPENESSWLIDDVFVDPWRGN
jgi:hypothetical protein